MNEWKKITFSKSEIAQGEQLKLVHEFGDLVMKEFIVSGRYDETVGIYSDSHLLEVHNTYIAPTDNVVINALTEKYNAVSCSKPLGKVALLVGYWGPLKDN